MKKSSEKESNRSLAPWVLSDKVNIPNFDLAYWTSPDGSIQPQIPNTLVPGGERWAGFGLKYGMLSFQNARELITPYEFAQMFKSLRDCKMMDKIWEHVTNSSATKQSLIASKEAKITKLVVWAPGSMFADPIRRTYFMYHPLVLETRNKKPDGSRSWLLVGYNNAHGTQDVNRNWTSLPTIDFLPKDKILNDRRIIAGSAGLLVIDGGKQSCFQKIQLWGVDQIPNENFWRHGDIYFNDQSITFVANPLTQEYIILPPLPGRLLNKKVGKFIWRNKERTCYNLILIGWDAEIEERSKVQKNYGMKKNKIFPVNDKLVESIGLFVYCSYERCYIYYDQIEGSPIPFWTVGSSCIAVIGYKIFVGGMKITKKGKGMKVHSPCVYYFNISNSTSIKKLMIPFIFKGILDSITLQAPKVVQGSQTQIFAITCATQAAITLYVVEIVIHEQKQDFWEFKLVAEMPNKFFNKLFSKSPCNDIYEVSGCNGLISFKASGKGICVVQYHIKSSQWSSTYFPRQRPSNVACYHLVDASYEPCFNVRP